MKPILFNTEMVQGIKEGRKKETRRVVKPVALGMTYEDGSPARKPPYHPGDILYVRETWCNINKPGIEPDYYYLADMTYEEDYDPSEWTWHPSIHMPKEAARLFLRVTNVRMERLQDMPHDGPMKEGIYFSAYLDGFTWQSKAKKSCCYISPMFAMIALWISTIKPADLNLYGWDANPWVWVIEFERISKEEM